MLGAYSTAVAMNKRAEATGAGGGDGEDQCCDGAMNMAYRLAVLRICMIRHW